MGAGNMSVGDIIMWRQKFPERGVMGELELSPDREYCGTIVAINGYGHLFIGDVYQRGHPGLANRSDFIKLRGSDVEVVKSVGDNTVSNNQHPG